MAKANTIEASIPVLRWAARRANLRDEDVTQRFPGWPFWLNGEAQPTLRQLEDFAKLTRTAFGYFFLPEPPTVELPIPDFRTARDESLIEISNNLRDTIYLCQQRQDWYRDHARLQGQPSLSFIGSAGIDQSPEKVAQSIRETLELFTEERLAVPSWEAALRQLIQKTEEIGILVMTSGVVGSNAHRRLNVEEFRGFALADDLAPLIFINGADSKSAQMFTLGHELAHLWLGETGISNAQAGKVPEKRTERWCNLIAAELLVPLEALHSVYQRNSPIADEIQRLASHFKVSTLVALRRLFDAGYIDQTTLWNQYRDEQDRLLHITRKRGQGGGNAYNTIPARASRRFSQAIIASALEGITSFSEANRLLGVRKTATFDELARKLGVTA